MPATRLRFLPIGGRGSASTRFSTRQVPLSTPPMQAETTRCPVQTTVSERMSGAWFRFVHLRSLVYNACEEDPRLDREALDLGPFDRVLVITSAGCNALDYALEGPE